MNNMEAFVFFTQVTGLERLGITHNSLNFKNSDVLTFQGNSNCFLVYDEIGKTTFEEQLFNKLNLIEGLKKVYYVRHSQPIREIIQAFDAYCTEKNIELIPNEDQHEPANSKYYKLLSQLNFENFSILDELIASLKKELGGDPILEAKLELLHNCLHPDSIPPYLDTLLSKYNNAFETFKTNAKGKESLEKGYLEALTQLRIDLLGS